MLKNILKFITLVLLLVSGTLTTNAAERPKKGADMNHETAVFAMGCFWCGESEFQEPNTHNTIPGIISVRVGYAGGTAPNPTYQSHEGYKEAIKIIYNPDKISYEQLLNIFWKNIDPLNAKGQFCDEGFAYTSAIFYHNDQQKELASKTKEEVKNALKQEEIFTEIIPYTTFYDAEEYHQNYKHKNPTKYKYYRWSCGRDKRLEELWDTKK